MEGCAADEGLDSHGDLPHCSPSESFMKRDLSGERVFVNPPQELVEHMARHFESCRRITPVGVGEIQQLHSTLETLPRIPRENTIVYSHISG
jgi:hypothetical protein